jgi:hypothetical protein
MNRDIAVVIATSYGQDDGGVKNFFFMSSRPALGPTQSPIQWVKRPVFEADHSPPASAEVKKTWLYITTPTYAFMAYA